MRRFHLLRNQQWKPSINLDKVINVTATRASGRKALTTSQLWSLVPADAREKHLKSSQDSAPVIDLLPLGYSKLLGKGRIPDIPVVVRVRYVSKEAERKVKEAGGIIELVA